jgi:hypothetical protein
MKVIARNSSLKFKGKEADLQEVANAPGAQAITDLNNTLELDQEFPTARVFFGYVYSEILRLKSSAIQYIQVPPEVKI